VANMLDAAWMSSGPRWRVDQLRFSMSLPPWTMAHA
jgi:hypothetical protein